MKHLFMRGAVIAVVSLMSYGSMDALAQSGSQSQVQMASSTTPKQKLEFTAKAVSEMEDSVKRVSKLLDTADRAGDVDKIQCVRNKQASVRALMEVSQRAEGAMKEALAENRSDRAEYEFRKIAVAVSKVRQFTAEAEACVGGAGAKVGSTEVEVTSDGVTDAEDTEPLELTTEVVGVDPPNTSPFE